MKAEELRIGNIVSAFGHVIKVRMIGYSHIIGDKLDASYDKLVGVPITQEWLLKFGFREDLEGIDYNLHENGFTIHFEINDGNLECYLESIGIDIEYVHQLQNLFFDLTGEELTIKPLASPQNDFFQLPKKRYDK